MLVARDDELPEGHAHIVDELHRIKVGIIRPVDLKNDGIVDDIRSDRRRDGLGYIQERRHHDDVVERRDSVEHRLSGGRILAGKAAAQKAIGRAVEGAILRGLPRHFDDLIEAAAHKRSGKKPVDAEIPINLYQVIIGALRRIYGIYQLDRSGLVDRNIADKIDLVD